MKTHHIICFVSIFILSEAKSTRDSESKQDSVACGELREEYIRVCTGHGKGVRAKKDEEFCNAFENICFSISEKEPDRAEEPIKQAENVEVTSAAPVKKQNFARFCKEFKNRYLYVCPDPFRFGQKAIVFCPVYSEKCQVPLPDKPVVPKRRSSKKNSGGSIEALCRSYRGFAANYCNNPFLTAQAQYRAACDKYWRFCGSSHRG
ncbi:unnamed protein product [Caenorhabditis bovis]|uniref:DUF19 domain-containing protein n=1 Tax=Caenorhabditis bovis TaxID=2654633 RepID=A0A8S1ESA7_9PELO|nr:unnamed protein product [Caenorhabditis bovis]